MTTIDDALKSDHDTHRDLLKKLAATQGDSGDRRKLRQTFCCDAGARAAAEALAFCSNLMAEVEGRARPRSTRNTGALIRGLDEMDCGAPGWMAC